MKVFIYPQDTVEMSNCPLCGTWWLNLLNEPDSVCSMCRAIIEEEVIMINTYEVRNGG